MIPVVDLMGGVVVRAKMGDREHYRTIETPLSRTADPVDVVRGLLSLAPFSTMYVADLDAILKRGHNTSVLRDLRQAYPEVNFWIDSGATDTATLDLIRPFGEPVLGSESMSDLRLLGLEKGALLSLDFQDEQFLGPLDILHNPNQWPERLIVMTLERVGSTIGPDWERLKFVRALAGSRQIFAAGGVRGVHDIHELREFGAAGVLVASALHDGRLHAKDLA